MSKYRIKTAFAEVEAVQFLPENYVETRALLTKQTVYMLTPPYGDDGQWQATLYSESTKSIFLDKGDWIVLGGYGGVVVFRAEDFEAMFGDQ